MVLSRRVTVAAVFLGCAAFSAPVDAAAQESPRSAYVPAPIRSVGVASGAHADALLQDPQRAWLGVGISCTRCQLETEGKRIPRWNFTSLPVVYSVDRGGPAARAGIRTGDTLVAIDGQELTTRAGGEAFANLRAGVRLRLTYARGDNRRTVSIVPVTTPLPAGVAEAERSYADAVRDARREADREAERARQELSRLQEEVVRNRGKVLDSASMRRIQAYVEQLRRTLREGIPVAPVPPGAAPEVYVTPMPAPVPYVVVPPARLRYSGRLGNTVIEARRSGGVNVTEMGDSLLVLAGGDLNVSIRVVEPSAPLTFSRATPSTSTVTGGIVRSNGGDVTYGVTGYLANPRLAAALGATAGVLVLDVETGSHADSLGVQPGDVLTELNGRRVVSITPSRMLSARLLRPTTMQPGAQTAVVVRARERLDLRLGPTAAAPRARTRTPPPRPTRPSTPPPGP